MFNNSLQAGAYFEGEYTGIYEVIQEIYPKESWKKEYKLILERLNKSEENVEYWVNYFFPEVLN